MATHGESATPNSGKFDYSPIKSPKESETVVLKQTGKTLPTSADKPDSGGR